MASPNVDYTEIITTTLRNQKKTTQDNVTNHNALLRRLSSKGKVAQLDGGETIVENLEYAENSTFQYYSGYEVLNINPSDVITAANFHWKQAGASVTISGLELRKNSGSNRVIELLETRIKNANKTIRNNLSIGGYSDGTGSAGKQIGGLQLLVADDPTSGTVGGIDRAEWAFWRNQVFDFSANSLTPSATTIQTAMTKIWLDCSRDTDAPDMFVGGTTYWTYYHDSLTANKRFTNDNEADATFGALKFNGADVFFDKTSSGLSATRMYALNTDYIYLKVHQDAFIEPLMRREPVNQDAIVVPLIFMGNMTLSNASLQGVIIP